MERAKALKRLTRPLLGVALLGGVVMLAYSCAGQRLPKAPPAEAPPKVTRLPSAQVAPPRSAPSEAVTLEGYEPVLARPEYAEVRQKLEAGELAAAAQAFEAALGRAAPSGAAYRERFVLGRLWERAGRFAEARTAFLAARSVDSPLASYAELGAGRMELALGFADRALVHVGHASEALPRAAGRRALLASAAAKSGADALSLQTYRELFEGAPAAERVAVGFELLGALSAGPLPIEPLRLEEALRLARRLEIWSEDDAAGLARAKGEQVRLLKLAPPGRLQEFTKPNEAERVELLRLLVDARKFTQAETLSAELPAFEPAQANPVRCEALILRGKVAAGRKRTSEAEQLYAELGHSSCSDELRARGLYLAGRAAQSQDRCGLAISHFGELERKFPSLSLADDARLYSALCSLELGDEARFTDALASMPDDYPDGDMTVEGSFRLALRRMERGDFGAAERPLLRAIERLPENEAARGGDFAGRERYFLARVEVETGERERGLRRFAEVVRDVPLGYYVRAAYSELAELAPEAASQALAENVARAEREPPSIATREPSAPGFRRALELWAAGEPNWVTAELSGLVPGEAAASDLLFYSSVLYQRAGAFKLSADAARSLLGQAPPRFPAGDWLAAWQLAYPRPYAEVVALNARKNAVSSSLVYAVMREESSFDPDAESPADAHGLMQLIVPTAKSAARPLGLPWDKAALRRPSVNIALGTRVLSQYAARFPNDPLLAVPAYNAGPGAPLRWKRERPRQSFDLWVELVPYVETRRYMKRVLGSAAVYAVVYGEGDVPSALKLPRKLAADR